jgi:hypothetical protein
MTQANATWLAAYAIYVVAIVGGMFYARSWVLAEYDTPEAKAEWAEWQKKARSESKKWNKEHSGPVDRRAPTSEEPPALIMMRDYFGTWLFGAVFFGSLLFGTLAITIRGAFSGDQAGESDVEIKV